MSKAIGRRFEDIVAGRTTTDVMAAIWNTAPFLNAVFNIDLKQYYTNAHIKLKVQQDFQRLFPDFICFPGIWADYGALCEPSAFGCPITWPNGSAPMALPAVSSLSEAVALRPPNPKKEGFMPVALDEYQYFHEIAARLDIRPSELVLLLSRKTNGQARILNHNYSNMEIIEALIKHPACLFMTDSLIFPRAFQNPASYGSFPLFLQYTRERKLVSVEEMIHRMTGATAERFNIIDRGLLKKGLAADITVFDWDNIRDNNTITETDQAPSGIEAVFINGQQVVESGQVDSSVCVGSVVRI